MTINIYCPKSPPEVHSIILLTLLAKPLRSRKPACEPFTEEHQFTPAEAPLQWPYNDLYQLNVRTH